MRVKLTITKSNERNIVKDLKHFCMQMLILVTEGNNKGIIKSLTTRDSLADLLQTNNW